MAETTSKTTKTAIKTKTATAKPKEAPAKKPVAAKKPATAKKTATAVKVENLTPEKRYRMIAEAAYFRAQSHQFKSDPVRDWIEAEQEIDAMLGKSKG